MMEGYEVLPVVDEGFDQELDRARFLLEAIATRYKEDNMPAITNSANRKTIEDKLIEIIKRW
jgi:hypothetical protein